MTDSKSRIAAALLTALMIVLAFPAAASANIVGQGSMQVSSNNVLVDAPGHTAVLTATNNNSHPNSPTPTPSQT